ncbi:hypothetical protein G6F25_014113 [Rhizopus arrhizus]|nr:hypothetical protein G6F25_014113 [Rhizopus arrhizus]
MVDCWKGYKGIDSDPSRNLIVETVNHSKTFRDPKTGACTNTIEGTWNGIKRGVTSRHRTASMMPWKLVEFIWRRKHASNHWKAMLACFSQVSFTRAGIADQGPLVSLLTTVLEDSISDQGEMEPITVGQKTDARNCKIPVLQLVVYGYCTKLSQTLIVCTSLERAFIRRLSDMGNDYWWNLRLLKGIL